MTKEQNKKETPIGLPQHSLRRRWVYRFMTFAIVLILVEVISIAVLVLGDRRIDYWVVNQNARESIPGVEYARGQPENEEERIQQGAYEHESHPYLGFTGDPNRSPQISPYGFANQYSYIAGDNRRTNSKKYDLPQRRTGRLIIALLGGSVAKNFSEKGTSSLVTRLRSHANYRDLEFHFFPLAYPGYKEPQQLLALNYFLSLGAEFDLVINIDGFNEVALHESENGTKGVFYAYPRSWFSYSANMSDKTLVQLRASVYNYRELRTAWASYASTRPLRYLAVINVIWRLGDRIATNNIRKATEEYKAYRPNDKPRYQVTGPNQNYSNRKELYRDLVGIWERSSRQLDQICRANNIDYFQVLQPNQYVAGSKPMSPAERAVAIRENHPYRAGAEFGYPFLIDAGKRLKENRVQFYDLTDVFANHPEPVYLDDCCHLNQQGHKIMARRIADAIIDSRSRLK